MSQKCDETTVIDVVDSTAESSEKDNVIPDDIASSPDFDSIAKNEAFNWLLSRLDRMIQCGSNAAGVTEIEKTMESHFSLIGSHNDAPCRATFKVNCNFLDFWHRQLVGSTVSRRLSRLITITGTYEDAQAMTCGQYLTQTWPVTGPQVMKHLNAVSMGHAHVKYSGEYSSLRIYN